MNVIRPTTAFPLAFALWTAGHALAQPAPITKATISPDLPSEVVDGKGVSLPVNLQASEPPFQFFDDFSWRSFLALNWPATADVRGLPDTTRQVGDTKGSRVWETWKSAYETIPQKGNEPTVWESFDAPTPCSSISAAGSGKMRIIASFTKFGDISEADFGDLAGPLVCRNDTYAHYEIKVNKPLYEGIRTKRLYDREVLDHLTAPVSFENGSVEIKAAWREFTDDEGEEVRSRYYRVHASLKRYDTGQCEDRELGLIGLHIVQKTPLRPQWVWSTFEHVDNVPAFGQTPSLGASFSLNDPKGPLNLDPVDPPLQVTDATYLDPAGHPVLPPMQVIRQRPIAGATADTNARYQNALRGTVWANYMLVMTQWPTKTTQPSGAPFPTTGFGTAITNTTMETYFQSSTSCMGCHDLSRHSNMDFVFFPMIHAARQDPGPENSTTQLFMDKLKINFAQFRQESITARQQLLGSDR